MALNLSAGDFNTKVVVKRPVVTELSQGDKAITHVPFLTTFAAVRAIDQKRLLEAGKTDFLNTVFIYLRYANDRKDISKDWLIEIGGLNYRIFAKPEVKESGLKVLEITAKAKGG